MRAITNRAQDDRCPLPVVPEAIPAVRCCIAATCRSAKAVTLRGAICVEHRELALTEAAPGVWIAWLMLRPGTHYGTIEARRKWGEDIRADTSAPVVRRHFTLTIPPFDDRDTSVPQVWVIREHGKGREDRLRDG